ncbi:MAG: HAD family hydrolase [Desulfobulbus sp.]|nr:HAD family hydrolase [Desulfobulbus sp.]
MRYKAVLFDLDGTLLDTLEDLANAGNRVLTGLSLPTHPVDAYRYFVGDGIATLVERILPPSHRQPERIASTVADFQREYAENWHDCSSPYAGIPEMLDHLVACGLRLAILSNKPDDFTQLCVEKLLPQWPFAPIFGQRPGIAKKPDPAAALEAAQRLNCRPKEVLYVGDTSIDMRTARSAGMDPVGVLWGFRGADELQEAGAAWLISHPRELPTIALSTPC